MLHFLNLIDTSIAYERASTRTREAKGRQYVYRWWIARRNPAHHHSHPDLLGSPPRAIRKTASGPGQRCPGPLVVSLRRLYLDRLAGCVLYTILKRKLDGRIPVPVVSDQGEPASPDT